MEAYWHREIPSIVRNVRVGASQHQKAVHEWNMIHYFHKEE